MWCRGVGAGQHGDFLVFVCIGMCAQSDLPEVVHVRALRQFLWKL